LAVAGGERAGDDVGVTGPRVSRELLASLMGLIVALSVASAPTVQAAPAGDIAVSTVARGLVSPWGLAFAPDGSALVGERDTGLIKRVQGSGRVDVVGRVPQSRPSGEGGLLGIAVDPEGRWVYAYATTASDNRILRMPWDGSRLGSGAPILTGIPKATIHNGGRLAFGPDGMLYASTGDAGKPELAQRTDSLAGKVLRIAPDGSIPPGNPFPGSPVWTFGHRNVQGLAFDAVGRAYASEFGAKDVDEVNLLTPGANYGWPLAEGATGRSGLTDPIATWSPTSIASPSGIAVSGGSAWVASLRGERLWRVPLVGDRAGRPKAVDLGAWGRLRTIAVAPDGSLWLMTSNTDGRGRTRPGDDRILRLSMDQGS